MPKIEVELTESTASILGKNDTALASLLEMIAPVMDTLIDDTAKMFSDQEWRAMATATRDFSLPAGERGRKRLLFFIEDADEFDGLRKEFGVDIHAIVEKINKLDEMHLSLTLGALQLAHTHFPTRLVTFPWWTGQARSSVPAQTEKRSSDEAPVQRKRGRKPGAPAQKLPSSTAHTNGNSATIAGATTP